MKNLVLTIITSIFSLLQLSAMDAGDRPLLKTISNEKTIVLNQFEYAAQVNSLTILDSRDNIVYTGEVNHDKNVVKYNLEKLPSGDYSVKVKGENFVKFHELKITKTDLVLEDKETYFKPMIRNVEKKVLIDMLFLDDDHIKVSVIDDQNDLAYSFKASQFGDFHKAFDFSELPKGKYNVIVTTDHFSNMIKVGL